MYASPVVYPLSMLDNSPRLRVLVQLNPMTSPIEIFRMATLGTGTVTTFGIVYSLILPLRRWFWASCCSAALKRPSWIPCKKGARNYVCK